MIQTGFPLQKIKKCKSEFLATVQSNIVESYYITLVEVSSIYCKKHGKHLSKLVHLRNFRLEQHTKKRQKKCMTARLLLLFRLAETVCVLGELSKPEAGQL
jgi:hypothetical protein